VAVCEVSRSGRKAQRAHGPVPFWRDRSMETFCKSIGLKYRGFDGSKPLA
jgi:hypothetical protein